MRRDTLLCLGLMAALSGIADAADDGVTASQLWAEFTKTPQAHRQLPDFSFVGYRYGESPLPQPRVVANVKEFGAKADDTECRPAGLLHPSVE